MPARATASRKAATVKQPASGAPDMEGVGHRRIGEMQRSRMLAAATEAACEQGAASLTVAHVVSRAGVSRRTFYEIFADRDDCLLGALEESLDRAAACVLPAYRAEDRWSRRIRASLAALLQFFDDNPYAARMLVIEALAAGPEALQRRQHVLSVLAAAMDEGCAERELSPGPPALTGEGLVGAVLALLHARMSEASNTPLVSLLNDLMSMIVLPYLGTSAARREQLAPAPSVAVKDARAQRVANPLESLDTRLTYRTARVLAALAAQPASSNRAIGASAGIADQGQVSKLMARLERLGLVQNANAGAVRGGANAWVLTEAGERVHVSIAPQRLS